METYLNLLIITLTVVFIVDYSGFINSIKRYIGKILHIHNYETISLKPIDCSLCSSFWTMLIYLIVTNNLSFPTLLVVIFLSSITSSLVDIFYVLNDIIYTILNVSKYLKK